MHTPLRRVLLTCPPDFEQLQLGHNISIPWINKHRYDVNNRYENNELTKYIHYHKQGNNTKSKDLHQSPEIEL